MKLENNDIDKIKMEIADFFSTHSLRTRIIYRTCSEKFGNESPHNLIPKKISIKHITVYLDFDNFPAKENLNFLIAFPDEDSDRLPELLNPRLGGDRPKVDLKKIPARYRFKNVADLFENWFSRFSLDP